MNRVWAFAALVALAVPTVAMATDEKAIKAAIDKGIERLWEDQNSDGSWSYMAVEGGDTDGKDTKDPRALGMTSLAVLALHENGAQLSDPRMRKALDYIREKSIANEDTYSVALAVTALSRIGIRSDRGTVKLLVRRLIDAQYDTGGWHYNTPKRSGDSSARAERRPGLGDLSVTQFVVLALYQASKLGVNVEDSLRLARHRLAWSQNPTGGWNYVGLPEGGDIPTMTTAGIYMWVVTSAVEVKDARRNKREQVLPIDPRPRKAWDDREEEAEDAASTARAKKKATRKSDNKVVDIYDALHRDAFNQRKEAAKKAGGGNLAGGGAPKDEKKSTKIKDDFKDVKPPILNVTRPNPLAGDQPYERGLKRTAEFAQGQIPAGGGYNYYYLWSVERFGVLIGEEKLGTIDWYQVGADRIVKAQREDGSWGVTKEESAKAATHYKYGPDNCFALLFLRKANLGSEITRMIKPDPAEAFYLASDPKKRFVGLAEAVAAAKAEETIMIQGEGPYPTGGVIIDKNITIKARPGYVPAFSYTIPQPKTGVAPDPAKEPNAARNLTVTKGAKVVIEGVHFRFEPPVSGSGDWAIARNDGSEVRFLNCTFSAVTGGGRPAPVGVIVENAKRTFFRNCFFNGVSAGVRVDGTGASSLLFKDCIAYSPNFVKVTGSGDANIFVMESTLQNKGVFDFGAAKGAVSVSAEHCIFSADALVSHWGEDDAKRSWSGLMNVYGLKGWIEKGSNEAVTAEGLKKWQAFTGSSETRSKEAYVTFEQPKNQIGPFRHDLSAQDWSVDEEQMDKVIILKVDQQLGANAFLCGTGLGHSQFLENNDYKDWFRTAKPPSAREQAASE
jgi:hypothetical protein